MHTAYARGKAVRANTKRSGFCPPPPIAIIISPEATIERIVWTKFVDFSGIFLLFYLFFFQ